MLTMNAVGLFVTDLKRTVSFYRDVMGMDVKWEWPDYVELFSAVQAAAQDWNELIIIFIPEQFAVHAHYSVKLLRICLANREKVCLFERNHIPLPDQPLLEQPFRIWGFVGREYGPACSSQGCGVEAVSVTTQDN